jgi:hypothetical protein
MLEVDEHRPMSGKCSLLILSLIFAAYWPAFQNGFISDDYVMLARAGDWTQNPLNPLSAIPEKFSFRLTSYAAFTVLKYCFGYHATFYYLFTIFLHCANAMLLWKIVRILSGSQAIAGAAAVLFATIQNPQEAVMWLTAMNDSLLGCFTLLTLLAWLRGRPAAAAAFLSFGLFSKESGVLILPLVVLVDFLKNRRLLFRKEYAYFALPAALFTALFLVELPVHPFLAQKSYAFRAAALLVLPLSLHRLCFPWVYLIGVIAGMAQGFRRIREGWVGLLWMTIALAPYIFINYQTHVPSRNQYIAAMGCAWLLADWIQGLASKRVRNLLVAVFVVVNLGYLWIKKGPHYRERAAPTAQFLAELQSRPPQRIRVSGFPYENPWIAKDVALAVPGWRPDMIFVGEPAESCPGCLALTWDTSQLKYR